MARVGLMLGWDIPKRGVLLYSRFVAASVFLRMGKGGFR